MTTERRKIELYWDGPHSPFENEGTDWNPPEKPGVYVFTIEPQGAPEPTPIITYVGEASDLRNRLNEHIFYFLGGGYALLKEEHLDKAGFLDDWYAYQPRAKRSNLVKGYLNDYERMSGLAIANLKRYRFSWAVLDQERAVRQAVESALISEAGEREHKENARLSLAEAKVEPLRIHSRALEGSLLPIEALAKPLEFGVKAANTVLPPTSDE